MCARTGKEDERQRQSGSGLVKYFFSGGELGCSVRENGGMGCGEV